MRSSRLSKEKPVKDTATWVRSAVLFTASLSIAMALFPSVATAQKLVYPAEVSWRNKIASDFHTWRGIAGGRRDRKHQGIDIRGPSGQLVIAIADGVVAETHVEKCWGPTISIDHGKDAEGRTLIALYGHVGEMLVAEGQIISRGDLIARLGNNHRQFKCIFGVRHLHLQLGRYRRLGKHNWWGSAYFLRDWDAGLNPHLLWEDGPYQVTCFDENREYPPGTLTYPVPCDADRAAAVSSTPNRSGRSAGGR